MKRLSFLILLGSIGFLGYAGNCSAAPDEIVWFGIDYTLVKFIGVSDQFSDLREIQEHYFRSWNELVVVESEKYDIKGAFGVRDVTYQMEKSISRSEKRDMGGIVQIGSYRVDESQVVALISEYTDPSDQRFGAIFFMETLNKIDEEVTMWLVCFKISTGDVLYIRRFVEKPGGFGFRNYWARGYYNVIKGLKESSLKPL
jgi:hypothetical protein